MRLQLENVGKVRNANVEINGITVIAGENNTGKSTIGKMLYCLFNAFLDIDRNVRKEREANVRKNILYLVNEFMPELRGVPRVAYGIDDFVKEIATLQSSDRTGIEEKLKSFIEFCRKEDLQTNVNQATFLDIVERIEVALQIPDDKVRAYILQRQLASEFGGQVSNVNVDEPARVRLNIKDKEIAFTSNGTVKIEKYINLVKRIVYIDNPFAIDELAKESSLYRYRNYGGHMSGLVNMIIKTSASEAGIIDEIVTDQNIKNILDAINRVSDGELQREEGHWIYKSAKFRKALEVRNLSTGVKTFTIIKTLLKNGMLEENGIMVLDEPEIHLHPEWQLKYAEIIVLLQKEFGINVLLNTHSPYFLWAIENCVNKYSLEEKYKLYETEIIEDSSILADMTNSSEVVYKKMADAFQRLETEEYEDE